MIMIMINQEDFLLKIELFFIYATLSMYITMKYGRTFRSVINTPSCSIY